MQSNVAPKGMVVTPHHLASQSALSILRDGGTAMEAMVAAAATIAVVYPHMNGIGGDGFWLILPPNGEPVVIEACGGAGSSATTEFYEGLTKIPFTGTKAAITVAGTVGGWEEALRYTSECGYRRTSVHRLLADAIRYAEEGVSITKNHKKCLETVKDTIDSAEFAKIFVPDGKVPEVGDIMYQKQLANTLRSLAENGLTSFYKGDVAKLISKDMALLGMPITDSDLASYTPERKVPLRLLHKHGQIFNLAPPTQGAVSLGILGILDQLDIDGQDEGKFIHVAVEATKLAFELRDEYITDPREMTIDPKSLISSDRLFQMANKINLDQASQAGKGKGPGDTIWMGIMDNKGFSVSFIQSVYHEFGSGVVLPSTGILWQNRGTAFTLEKNHILSVKPGKKPLHTLNPAAAKLNDGRVMVYGTRGGDGQPQTQAAIFHRYVVQNLELQASVSAPRWLYGRDAGEHNDCLRIEGRFHENTIKYLKERNHKVVLLPEYSQPMGHAGILVRHPNGMMEGAFDPRGNGSAAGF